MRSLKSGFVGFIKKQKQERNTMVPCGHLMKPLHGSSVGISTAGFILARHWMCPLPQHSSELSNRNTPRRFYHLLDWVGAYVPNCRHGTRWCNKCATIADTVFSDEQDYSSCKGMYKYNVSLFYILFQLKRYVKYLCKVDSRRLKNATQ